MNRETALNSVAPNLSYFNNCKPAFAIQECKLWIDKIYDDFESRTCENCKKDYMCSIQDAITKDAKNLTNIGFGCNKYKSKT